MIWGGALCAAVSAASWTYPAAHVQACVTGLTAAPSLLQSRAQPQGSADGTAHPPFGPLGPPRCSGQRSDLPRPVLLLCLRQHLAAMFIAELAAHVWRHIHVTHLPSVLLMYGRVSAPLWHAGGMRPAPFPDGPDTGPC